MPYNKPLIRKILEFVTVHEDRFDMSSWTDNPEETCTNVTPDVKAGTKLDVHECDTTACVAGWAGLLTGMVEQVWMLDWYGTESARDRAIDEGKPSEEIDKLECFISKNYVPEHMILAIPALARYSVHYYNTPDGFNEVTDWSGIGQMALGLNNEEARELFSASETEAVEYLNGLLDDVGVMETRDARYAEEDSDDTPCTCSVCTGSDDWLS